MKRLQLVASGRECVSSLEASHELILRADFADSILAYDGTTGDVIKWSHWDWKAWDVEYLIREGQPAEAIPIVESGLSTSLLESITYGSPSTRPQPNTYNKARLSNDFKPQARFRLTQIEPVLPETPMRPQWA
jgi:hypothetical protein